MIERAKPRVRHDGIDMTQGKPWRGLLSFCTPLLLGNLLQQMYNTVDAMVVGRFVGADALAAVGTSGPIIHLMIALFTGLSAGTSILISQAFGAKDHGRLSRTVHTAITLALICSALVTAVGCVLAGNILRLLNTPGEVFSMARGYMIVTFVGVAPLMSFNLLNAVLHGTGDAKSPLWILLVCCAINTVLDLVFVAVFGWGVQGAAWATVIGHCCSVVFGLRRVNETSGALRIRWSQLRVDMESARQIVRVGLPAGAQNALTSVGNILVQGVINGFGPVVMAANIAVIKVDSFCTMPIMTFGTATTIYVGQNVGAGKCERIHQGVKAALSMSVALSALISVLLFFFGATPLALFTTDPSVIQAGMDKFHRVAPFYSCIAIFAVLGGASRGQGRTLVPMLIGVITMFLGRVPVAYLLSRVLGANGIHWSLSVQWLLEAICIAIYTAALSHRTRQR